MSSRISQSLSLLIPRVFPQWTDEQVIIDIFHQQHIGRVYKVNVIRLPDHKNRSHPIYQAFIYFSAWYETEIAYNFQQRIFGEKKQARLVYDDPWFWTVFENKKRSLSNNDKRLIRLGYQAYVTESNIEQLHHRIRAMEKDTVDAVAVDEVAVDAVDAYSRPVLNNWPVLDGWATATAVPPPPAADAWLNATAWLNAAAEPYPYWNYLSAEYIAAALDKELILADANVTAAEAALAETATRVAEAALANEDDDYEAKPSWLAYQQTQLEATAMEVLGAELTLTETAIRVAEAALADEEDQYEAKPSWLAYQQTQLEATAMEVLGAELALTETAIRVAEAALADE